MRNLKTITEDYLSKPTDFAIQIVGSWGYGKTYFYRNTLEKSIYDKPTHNNATKKYKPIYISLFGLKSVEDIATKIVLDFYQSKYFQGYFKKTLTKKRLKITQSVLKIGLRGFLNFKRLGNVNDYLTDIKTIGENVLDTNELVICFDDLERKDSSLKIEDLTGYINSLVDEGIKVLIISNEDLLLKEGDIYKNLKEKIIGITVEFIPNTKETLENIIKLRYSTFPVFLKYLSDCIEDLVKLSKATNNNFRHIIYALDSLHNCYSKIKKDIIDAKHEICEKLEQEIPNISTLTLALAVEYKSTALKYSDLKDYRDDYVFLHELFTDKPIVDTDKKEEEKSKLEILLTKYDIKKENYHLYESIYNYVTGYDEFAIEIFVAEFKKKFNLEKGKVLPQYEILHSLSYQNCFNLSDEEYNEKTLAVIEYAKSGLYAAVDYLSIMHYAERLDNILNLNLDEVKDGLIAGLHKSIESTPSAADLSFSQFEMSGKMSEISDVNEQLYKAGMKEIKLFEERKTKEKIESIANLLTTSPTEFQNQYRTDNNFQYHLSYYPFLNYIPPEKLLENIKKADSQTLHFLRNFFKDRYENTEKFKQEFENFKKFTDLLTAYQGELAGKEGNKIRNYIVSEFADSLVVIRNKGLQLFEPQIIEPQ